MPSPWLAAIRPRTLPAALAPVAAGTACAATVVSLRLDLAALCLLGALLLQIAANFANDLGDALRGADSAQRTGPQRAVAAGLISRQAMAWATALVLFVSLLPGTLLVLVGGWPIALAGLLALICAPLYTLGPRPLAYLGLGEVFVLLFFGVVAVLGTAWIQAAAAGTAQIEAWWVAVALALGLQAAAILAINNHRDRTSDQAAGKRTLAVRWGERGSRGLHLGLHLGAAVALAVAALAGPRGLWGAAVLALLGGLWLARALARHQGPALNLWLGRAALLEMGCAGAIVAACAGGLPA